jgi:hypothetical protein
MEILPFPQDTAVFEELAQLRRENQHFRRLVAELRGRLRKFVREIDAALHDGGGG